jgi:hypothetical protein
MHEQPTNLLASLISQRRQCLAQLRDLGLRQAQLIAMGDMQSLVRLVGAKQQLIVALQSLETRLAPFHDEDPDSRHWESPEARAACASDAAACRELIQEVMAMEQDGERQMTARRDAVAAQLRSAAAGGRVREAYQAQAGRR